MAFEVGARLPARTFRVTRADLVRYAGASGDFNPIHWSDRAAATVGLPGVIAHGMLTMALVGRAVTGWAGDPAAVVDYNVRFTKPVLPGETLSVKVWRLDDSVALFAVAGEDDRSVLSAGRITFS